MVMFRNITYRLQILEQQTLILQIRDNSYKTSANKMFLIVYAATYDKIHRR